MDTAVIGASLRVVGLNLVDAVHAARRQIELLEAGIGRQNKGVIINDCCGGDGFVEQPAIDDLASGGHSEQCLFVDVEEEQLLATGMPDRSFAKRALAVDEQLGSLAHSGYPAS